MQSELANVPDCGGGENVRGPFIASTIMGAARTGGLVWSTSNGLVLVPSSTIATGVLKSVDSVNVFELSAPVIQWEATRPVRGCTAPHPEPRPDLGRRAGRDDRGHKRCAVAMSTTRLSTMVWPDPRLSTGVSLGGFSHE
jgi:hypothetical protein